MTGRCRGEIGFSDVLAACGFVLTGHAFATYRSRSQRDRRIGHESGEATGDRVERGTFEIIGQVFDTETIAIGSGIREIGRLRKVYGPGRWRKRKGFGTVRLPSGMIVKAEVHWYEAQGYGRKEMKIKRICEP